MDLKFWVEGLNLNPSYMLSSTVEVLSSTKLNS